MSSMGSMGISPKMLFFIGFILAHSGTFITLNLWLMMCYRNGWFMKYRIQGNVLPEWSLIKECLISNLISHCVVGPLVLWYGHGFFIKYGIDVLRPAPDAITVLRDFIIFVGFNDTLFYWIHRAVHHKYLYKYIHKHHHRFKINIGICSEFANPVEDALANIMPTIIGAFVMGSHPITLFLWVILRVWETVDSHSGYLFKFSPFHQFSWQGGADRHDFHHSHNIGCFGSFTIFWDWICGTDQAYLEFRKKHKEVVGDQPVKAKSMSETTADINKEDNSPSANNRARKHVK